MLAERILAPIFKPFDATVQLVFLAPGVNQ
jgi:hypothetical protein